MLVSGLRRLISRYQVHVVPRRMNRKVRYIASADEVTITRDGNFARIEYKEEGIPETRLQIDPESPR